MKKTLLFLLTVFLLLSGCATKAEESVEEVYTYKFFTQYYNGSEWEEKKEAFSMSWSGELNLKVSAGDDLVSPEYIYIYIEELDDFAFPTKYDFSKSVNYYINEVPKESEEKIMMIANLNGDDEITLLENIQGKQIVVLYAELICVTQIEVTG